MTAPVPQAAVDAAQLARGCSPIRRTVGERRGPLVCNTHGCEWSDAGCLVAIDVAAAVVTAVQGPIKAEALREAAVEIDTATQSWNRNEGASIVPDPWGDPALRVPLPEWLRNRAERIEAQ